MTGKYLFPADYMADPSVKVFGDRLYIYPSHDVDVAETENDNGDCYNMSDYHVLSTDDLENGEVVDHGCALSLEQIKWARRQLWDCDCSEKNGKYYLYFPAKDHNDVFHFGVAVADKPEGPFVPMPDPIRGSYSIDVCVLADGDKRYFYFGGIWGGQLQRYRDNLALENPFLPKDDEPALGPKVALLADDMLQFAEAPREIVILDEKGEPMKHGDPRRFFEATWVHKYNGKYYLTWSTGDYHTICYGVSDSPYGPFTFRGEILKPMIGWTTHCCIAEYKGKWYLFYHDSQPSGGKSWLRSLKVAELHYDENGDIIAVDDGSYENLKTYY